MNLEHFNLNRNDYMPDEEINRLYGDFHIDTDPDHPSTTGAGPSSSTQHSSKKRKKKKSMVWDCFEVILVKDTAGIEVEHAQCLKQVESRINNIMGALGWIMASNQRIAEFSRYCTSKDILPRKFQTDMPVRWNSTYLMLKSALPYAELITSFYNVNTANDTGREKLKDGDCKATTSRTSCPGSSSQSQSQSQGQRQHVELNRYLTTEYSITENDDFTTNDLLKWWRGKRNNFPILSRLACDVLVIPVSTVSSEQVFSTAGRILEEKRCPLANDAVEALTCLKD
ncbi:hypothetical protein Dsin_013831 [Dipteronia sinensis]|uniref:HAT C-terminal dimerisation domain-containing protein n=1 Tax=Dipteronia sinensis TaxID=43782 RepID=A0AAE0E9D0_9ROSI|nr:hypothetical protein Dsin_013831 [Dipteronia sinensis]